MTSKPNADVNVNVNLKVNLNICETLVTNVTNAHMVVASRGNTICPTAAFGRLGNNDPSPNYISYKTCSDYNCFHFLVAIVTSLYNLCPTEQSVSGMFFEIKYSVCSIREFSIRQWSLGDWYTLT